jgi:hypothetical protein
MQSITNNLTNGDDGSCGALQTEESFLEPSSSFGAGSSKCYWLIASEKNEYDGRNCYFVQPDSSLNMILFVAILSAVVSTPIVFTLDWVIQHILAPTRISHQISPAFISNDRLKRFNSIVPDSSSMSVAHTPRTRRKAYVKFVKSGSSEDNLLKNAQKEFEHLTDLLKSYRALLSDKKEFDG